MQFRESLILTVVIFLSSSLAMAETVLRGLEKLSDVVPVEAKEIYCENSYINGAIDPPPKKKWFRLSKNSSGLYKAEGFLAGWYGLNHLVFGEGMTCIALANDLLIFDCINDNSGDATSAYIEKRASLRRTGTAGIWREGFAVSELNMFRISFNLYNSTTLSEEQKRNIEVNSLPVFDLNRNDCKVQ